MEPSLPHNPRTGAGPTGAARLGASPLVVLLVAGLLADVASSDEAHAGLEYALSLLALLGASGCAISLVCRLSSGLEPLPWAGPTASRLPVPAALANVPENAGDWPLLVALLFGPFVVLLAGLGGWV